MKASKEPIIQNQVWDDKKVHFNSIALRLLDDRNHENERDRENENYKNKDKETENVQMKALCLKLR